MAKEPVQNGVRLFPLKNTINLIPQNSKRFSESEESTNPAVRVTEYKAEVMAERIREINPDADIRIHKCFFLPENADDFPFAEYDYIVDAVDTVTAKLALVMKAQELHIPIISSIGAGNKLDPTALRVADIYITKVCQLATV